MTCQCCGDNQTVGERPLGPECEAQGFHANEQGVLICPTCGEDFKECGCSAPDSAIM
jgi:hypothetical protein